MIFASCLKTLLTARTSTAITGTSHDEKQFIKCTAKMDDKQSTLDHDNKREFVKFWDNFVETGKVGFWPPWRN